MTTTQGAHTSLMETLLILVFLSWSRALKRKSNHLAMMWIFLEDKKLDNFENSFNDPHKDIF